MAEDIDTRGASELVKDLATVPQIVGALGLSIAAAQKAFNLDYLHNVEHLLVLIKNLLGGKKLAADGSTVEDMTAAEKARLDAELPVIKDLLAALAPPRYQYTETTFDVRLDLAQTTDVAGSVGLGVGLGAISVNAAFSMGYGSDYRAAAACKTVIHAIPADATVFNALMERAKEINDKVLELPARSVVDQQVIEQSGKVFEGLLGVKAPKAKSGS